MSLVDVGKIKKINTDSTILKTPLKPISVSDTENVQCYSKRFVVKSTETTSHCDKFARKKLAFGDLILNLQLKFD